MVMELANFPPEILDILKDKAPATNGFKLDSKIPNGQRNDHLFKYACKLRQSGLEDNEIMAATEIVNKERCLNPLKEAELRIIIEQSCKYKKGQKETKHPLYEVAEKIRDKELGFEYIYCMENDKFYIYEDNCWRTVMEMDLLGAITERIPDINKETLHQKKQIIEHLRIMVRRRMDIFNRTDLLNFPEGEFDPVNQTLHEHDKENYSTIRLPYSYNPNAVCPLWEKTLSEIFEEDDKKISVLQEFFGYCLVPDVRQKKALLLLGESDSGKSTILFILKALFGKENCSSVPLKHIGHPQYTPMMINKLVNIDTDVSKNAQDFEEDFKKITSGEEVTCNQKFIETFEFVPKCRMVLAANIFPKITDHSSAFYNRLILIPCDRIFSEAEKNRDLVETLKREELPGIFNWCLIGLKRLRERKMFEQHSFIKEAVGDLEDANNPSNLFFREHIEIVMGMDIEKGELYGYYKQWSELNKQYTLPSAMFSTAIYKQFHKVTPKKAHTDNKRVWRNLKYVHLKISEIEDKGWTE